MMNAPSPEQIQALLTTYDLLSNSGTLLIVILVVGVVFGTIATGLLLWDWSRNRLWNWPAIAAVIVGIVLVIAGYILYGAAGRIISIEINTPRVWIGTEYQALSDHVKAMVGASGGWGVIGLTAGALFVLLGVVGIVKNFLLRRRNKTGTLLETASPAS